MNTKRNFSFKKSAALINGIIANSLTTMARYQTEAIERGIDRKTDIIDKPFKRLRKDSTLPIRNRRGHGFTPLDTMQKTRKSLLDELLELEEQFDSTNVPVKILVTPAEIESYYRLKLKRLKEDIIGLNVIESLLDSTGRLNYFGCYSK